MRLKIVSIAAMLAAAITSVQAAPIVQTAGVAVVDFGAPSTFSFSFLQPISIAGSTNVTVSVLGAYGDFLRDGAAVTPTSPNALAYTNLGGATVAAAGGSASFAGAGGAPGTVLLAGIAVMDVGVPSNFGFLFAKPIAPTTGSQESRGAVAGGIVDGGFDGATLNGQYPGGDIARYRVTSADSQIGSLEVGTAGADDSAPFISFGSEQITCPVTAIGCNGMETGLMFTLSGGHDVAAMISRQELGGDALQGTVLSTYGIETGSGMFNCSTIVGGCTFLTTTISFQLSGGGDAAAFAVRVVVDSGVPEPGTLALLGLGLASLACARRRKAQ